MSVHNDGLGSREAVVDDHRITVGLAGESAMNRPAVRREPRPLQGDPPTVIIGGDISRRAG